MEIKKENSIKSTIEKFRKERFITKCLSGGCFGVNCVAIFSVIGLPSKFRILKREHHKLKAYNKQESIRPCMDFAQLR